MEGGVPVGAVWGGRGRGPRVDEELVLVVGAHFGLAGVEIEKGVGKGGVPREWLVELCGLVHGNLVLFDEAEEEVCGKVCQGDGGDVKLDHVVGLAGGTGDRVGPDDDPARGAVDGRGGADAVDEGGDGAVEGFGGGKGLGGGGGGGRLFGGVDRGGKGEAVAVEEGGDDPEAGREDDVGLLGEL